MIHSECEESELSSLIRHKLDAARKNALSLVERAVEKRQSVQVLTGMLGQCYETALDTVFAAGESSLRSETFSRFEKEEYDAIQGQAVLDHASRNMWSSCESGRMELERLARPADVQDENPRCWIVAAKEKCCRWLNAKRDRTRQSRLIREAGDEFIAQAEEIILRKWNEAEEWFTAVIQQKNSSEEG